MKRVLKRLCLGQKISGVLSAFVLCTIKRGADGGAASASGPMTRTAGSTERGLPHKRRATGFLAQELAASASGLCLCELTHSSLSISAGQRAQAQQREGLTESPVCLWLLCRDESLPQGHEALSPLWVKRQIHTVYMLESG